MSAISPLSSCDDTRRRDCYIWKRRCRAKAGDNDHSYRLGRSIRAGQRRPGFKFGATGRQRTGLSIQQPELINKRLELLREVIPQLRRLAVMANANYAPPMLEAERVRATAHALDLEAARLEIWRSEEIAPAFEVIRGKADALYVVSDALIAANRTLIVTPALSAGLPTILSYRDYVEAGGLMSYGPNYADLFRRAAEMVDKILNGTKPSDIPIEQPSKFELVINLATARAIGVTVPSTVLARADEVIE